MSIWDQFRLNQLPEEQRAEITHRIKIMHDWIHIQEGEHGVYICIQCKYMVFYTEAGGIEPSPYFPIKIRGYKDFSCEEYVTYQILES